MNLSLSGDFWEKGMARARIGLIANNENDCNSPDSFIGFGTSYTFLSASNSAGNYAAYLSDSSDVVNTQTMGYIMVR